MAMTGFPGMSMLLLDDGLHRESRLGYPDIVSAELLRCRGRCRYEGLVPAGIGWGPGFFSKLFPIFAFFAVRAAASRIFAVSSIEPKLVSKIR